MIPIPFKNLNIVIDLRFQILDNYIPSLLSMKDMIENGLGNNIQSNPVTNKNFKQELAFENLFLIHRCNPADMDYFMSEEQCN